MLEQTVATKPEAPTARMSSDSVALRRPLIGTKGPSPNSEQQPHTVIPPTPNLTVGTMHSGRG